MDYRRLGASGLKVPALSFGAGTFGGSGPLFGAWGNSDARKRGGWSTSASRPASTCSTPPTSIRTALPKRCWAQAIKGRRDTVLISTKTALPMGDGPSDAGSSRSRLIKAVEAALRAPRHRLHRPAATARLRCRHADRGGAVDAGRPRARRQAALCRRLQLLRLAGDEIAGRRRQARLPALRRPSGLLFAGRPRL